MKKIVLLFVIFFWSLIYPNLAFNKFTAEIINEDLGYSDLFNSEKRAEIIQNAVFVTKFW